MTLDALQMKMKTSRQPWNYKIYNKFMFLFRPIYLPLILKFFHKWRRISLRMRMHVHVCSYVQQIKLGVIKHQGNFNRSLEFGSRWWKQINTSEIYSCLECQEEGMYHIFLKPSLSYWWKYPAVFCGLKVIYENWLKNVISRNKNQWKHLNW